MTRIEALYHAIEYLIECKYDIMAYLNADAAEVDLVMDTLNEIYQEALDGLKES